MRFGGLQALDAVTFDVEQGSIVGLIGPNGSGKTTLMNVISGVFKPSAGAVKFKGVRIASVAPRTAFPNWGSAGRSRWCARSRISTCWKTSRWARCTRARARNVPRRDAFAYGAELLEFVGLDRVARQARQRSDDSRTASGWSWRKRSPSIPRSCCSTK